MNDYYVEALRYVAEIWRRRWYVVMVSILVAAAGWGYVCWIPDNFSAQSQIFFDTKTVLGPLLKGIAVDRDVDAELRVMQLSLLSRPALENIARQTDRDVEARTPEQIERMIATLKRSIHITGGQTNVFIVTADDTQPQRAKKTVDALVDMFVDRNLGSSRQDLDGARRFIDAQIAHYGGLLEKAEAALAEFNQNNPGSDTSINQKLDVATAALDLAESQLHDSVAQATALREQLHRTPPVINLTASGGELGPPRGGASKLSDYEVRLRQLKEQFTDQHPDVITLKRRIEEVQATEGEGEQEPAAPNEVEYSVPNPTYSNLEIQLAAKDAEVAAVRDKVMRQRTMVTQLKEQSYAYPQREADLARLTRDYTVLKTQYDQLLTRRESANISQERGAVNNAAQFRIIQPATVPAIPSGPNRPIMLSVVFALSIAAGLSVGLAFALLDNTYNSSSPLREEFDAKLVVVVTRVLLPAARRRERRDMAAVSCCFAALVIAYATLMTLEQAVGLHRLVSDITYVRPAALAGAPDGNFLAGGPRPSTT